MKHFVIKVINFDKHNSKTSGRRMLFFYCSSSLARSPKYLALSSGAKHMFIWLLCESAKSSTRECWVEPMLVAREVHVTPQYITRTLRELVDLEWIQILTEPTSKVKVPRRKEGRKEGIEGRKEGEQIAKAQKYEPTKPKEPDPKPRPAAPPQVKPEDQVKTDEMIAAYCDAWKLRYKSERSPPIEPRYAKSLKDLTSQQGAARVKDLLGAYLRMPDSWYLTKRHDLATFMSNLTAISHFADTGLVVTKKELHAFDNAMTNQNTLQALREGKV